MGGFDLFVTRMNNDSTWTEPQNLGYPINTYNDEMGLIIESNGQKHTTLLYGISQKVRTFSLSPFMNQYGLIPFLI